MIALGLIVATLPPAAWPWPHDSASTPLLERVPPPEGAERLLVEPGSFGAWLRQLPVLPGTPPVLLFDGRPKRNQTAQAYVLDLDVGKKDLQQCADAVMRLYAEYLVATGASAKLSFHLTSGAPMPFQPWIEGDRPVVLPSGQVRWAKGAAASGSGRAVFGAYLELVFTYAGSASLAQDLRPPTGPIEPGDVVIHGGHPGHAVIVLDVAIRGEQRFALLAQSYMPAQQIHVLRSLSGPDPTWVPVSKEGVLTTPEWTFDWSERRRFGCTKACNEAPDRQR
ncbi:MAG: DUF4846 domain-containing protein [Myxococcota bacterium]